MIVVRNINKMQSLVASMKDETGSIGFVPTMGAFHEGHLSLFRKAKNECAKLIVSIFVNPIQFDKENDLKNYPLQLKKDIKIAKEEKVDVVFAPCAEDVYPKEFCTFVIQEKLSDTLCGKKRPGHFRGVATIVTKLFNIVKPHRAYFGQKDYQQSVIIKRLVKDLHMDIDIKVLPTVRDKYGLALSSRNKHLNSEERLNAHCINDSLAKAMFMVKSNENDVKKIMEEMQNIINKVPHTKIDYVSIVDPDTLEEVTMITGKAVAAVAVWIGNTRLIDNIVLET